ncbi:hypothetical protein, partial [Burkholderia multivorans]|uniref:hypothetical protein n=1 Tax=Burkholderia multivorans TaxID=87883 RepID=UPI001ABB4682
PQVPCDRAIASPDVLKVRRQVTQSLSNPPRFPAMNLSLSAARDMVPTTEKIDVGFRRPLRVDDDARDGKHFVI